MDYITKITTCDYCSQRKDNLLTFRIPEKKIKICISCVENYLKMSIKDFVVMVTSLEDFHYGDIKNKNNTLTR